MVRGNCGGHNAPRGQERGRGKPTSGNNSNSSQNTSRPICQVCSKVGRVALKCFHMFDQSYQAEDTYATAMVTTPSYAINLNWYTDTGATDHITGDLNKLLVREKYHGNDQVQVANGSGLSILHTGHSHISTPSWSLQMSNILHVPNIARNLLSVHCFSTDNNVLFEFHPDDFLVKD